MKKITTKEFKKLTGENPIDVLGPNYAEDYDIEDEDYLDRLMMEDDSLV